MAAIIVLARLRERQHNIILRNEWRFKDRGNPFDMSEHTFIQQFRLLRMAVRDLCDDLRPYINARYNGYTPEMLVLSSLQILGTGSFQNSLTTCHFSRISQPTLSRNLDKFLNAIMNILPNYVQFPRTNEELLDIKATFFEQMGFPNVVGAIDCTHCSCLNRMILTGFFSEQKKINIQSMLKCFNTRQKASIFSMERHWPVLFVLLAIHLALAQTDVTTTQPSEKPAKVSPSSESTSPSIIADEIPSIFLFNDLSSIKTAKKEKIPESNSEYSLSWQKEEQKEQRRRQRKQQRIQQEQQKEQQRILAEQRLIQKEQQKEQRRIQVRQQRMQQEQQKEQQRILAEQRLIQKEQQKEQRRIQVTQQRMQKEQQKEQQRILMEQGLIQKEQQKDQRRIQVKQQRMQQEQQKEQQRILAELRLIQKEQQKEQQIIQAIQQRMQKEQQKEQQIMS